MFYPKGHRFSVGGFGMETSNFALNGCLRVSTVRFFDARSNGRLRMSHRALWNWSSTKNVFFDNFYTNFRRYVTLLSRILVKIPYFPTSVHQFWDLHSNRLEIIFNLRPLDSYLVQKWRFKYVFNDFQLNWDSQQGRVRTTSVKVKKRLGTSNFRPKRLSRVSKNPVFQAESIGGLRLMHTGRKLRFFDEKLQ